MPWNDPKIEGMDLSPPHWPSFATWASLIWPPNRIYLGKWKLSADRFLRKNLHLVFRKKNGWKWGRLVGKWMICMYSWMDGVYFKTSHIKCHPNLNREIHLLRPTGDLTCPFGSVVVSLSFWGCQTTPGLGFVTQRLYFQDLDYRPEWGFNFRFKKV